LSEFAQRYWDSHISFFEGANKNSSFYYRGTSGFIAKMVTYLLKARGLKHAVAELYECNTLHEQREVYERSIGPRLWTPTVEWLIARESTMALLGVPAAQKALMDEQYPGGVVGYVKFCLERVLTELPWRDNYFYRVYLRGAYTEDCCPEYLKADTFETLRGRVKDLHIHTNTVAGYLEKLEVKFSRFVLLDHMDWMSKYDVAGLTHEWNTILASATDGARAIFRSAAVRVDFLNNVMVQRAGARVPLLDFITFDKERATALHSKDRVGTYASFHIANLHPTV
jgi:S-adenosylmethionine-diacylglycerol 3-amino-3-carboxypropyl transferase